MEKKEYKAPTLHSYGSIDQFTFATPTQTLPSPLAMPCGPPFALNPAGIKAVTLFEAASTFVTDPPW